MDWGDFKMLNILHHKKDTEKIPTQGYALIIEGMNKLCAGELTAMIHVESEDPLAPIAAMINQYSAKNAAIFTKLSMTMNEVVYAGLLGGDKLNQLSLQSHQQADAIQQIAAAILQVASSVNNLAESTSQAAGQSSAGTISMELTSKSVEQLSSEGQEVKGNLTELNFRISELHMATTRIDELVSVVTGISEQTNLLALNAAIEAARAGEQGRGFSVVAEEVRKLADQSRQSVEEITSHLTEIRNQSDNISSSFKKMGTSFEKNAVAVTSADKNISQLKKIFEKIDEAVANLAPIAEEQSATFEELSATIGNLSTQVSELNSITQDCNRDIMGVIHSANDVRVKVSSLQIPFSVKQILDLAKADHLLWKAHIDYMLRGFENLDEDNVKNHRTCRLGMWYFGEGMKLFGHLKCFQKLDKVHTEFHDQCAEAIRLYKIGDKVQAQQVNTDIQRLSSLVVGILDEIKLLQ